MTTPEDRVIVFFRTHGYRVLATELVVEHGLLVPAAA
jgi:hypothetical protein